MIVNGHAKVVAKVVSIPDMPTRREKRVSGTVATNIDKLASCVCHCQWHSESAEPLALCGPGLTFTKLIQ